MKANLQSALSVENSTKSHSPNKLICTMKYTNFLLICQTSFLEKVLRACIIRTLLRFTDSNYFSVENKPTHWLFMCKWAKVRPLWYWFIFFAQPEIFWGQETSCAQITSHLYRNRPSLSDHHQSAVLKMFL